MINSFYCLIKGDWVLSDYLISTLARIFFPPWLAICLKGKSGRILGSNLSGKRHLLGIMRSYVFLEFLQYYKTSDIFPSIIRRGGVAE
jgi:hypothetical protein